MKFVTKMVLAAPEVGDISGGLKVGNEDEDGSEYLATSHIRPCFIFHRSFLFFFFFFFLFSSTNDRTGGRGKKKLILVIAIQISFERTTHPSFPPFSSPFSSSSFSSSSRETFVLLSFLYNSVAFSFLLPLTIRGSP